MNKLYMIGVLLLLVYWGTGCQDIPIGYLQTEDASYNPDTMAVKKVLVPGEDDLQIKWGAPWVSTPIEGVEGTAQIFVTIKGIREESGGSVTEALEHIKVYGDGTFEVPVQHTIPVGRYVISLNFRNEGYSKDVDDCFTIIVK